MRNILNKYNKYNVAPKEDRTWIGQLKGREQKIIFDSKSEMNYFCGTILIRIKIGEISELELQPRFELQEGEKYVGDFLYFDKKENKWICEDVKGVETAIFKSKWKRVKALYPNIVFKKV